MKRVYLIGDSTCQTNDATTFPQFGWGQVFSSFLEGEYEVVNLAKNGRSTKSFIDEGLFQPALDNMKEGDLLFIQFGHNDEKEDAARHTDPFSTYQDNLLYFVNSARERGATPILLSSIYRRHFNDDGTIKDNVHLDYPDAMKLLAERENVYFIDMCALTKEFLSSIGDEASKKYFMIFPPNVFPNYPEGKADNTHLQEAGARKVCEILCDEIRKGPYANLLK